MKGPIKGSRPVIELLNKHEKKSCVLLPDSGWRRISSGDEGSQAIFLTARGRSSHCIPVIQVYLRPPADSRHTRDRRPRPGVRREPGLGPGWSALPGPRQHRDCQAECPFMSRLPLKPLGERPLTGLGGSAQARAQGALPDM
jgi:hypothetical protein